MSKRHRSAVDGRYVSEAEANADPERTVTETVRPHLGREAAIAVLNAMGLPLEGCSAVRIETPPDEFATVVVTYVLTGDVLKAAGEALQAQVGK